MRFNATTSLITNTSAEVVGSNARLTIVMWLRALTSGEGSQARAFVMDEAGNAISILLGGGSVIQLSRVYSGGTANWGVTNGGGIWEIGPWFCVAFTLDASTDTNDPICYISKRGADGGMVARALTTNTNSTGTPTGANGGFTIGNRAAADRTWDGDIAFLQVFNRILSPQEINDCAFRPGKVKKERALWAPLIDHPWVMDANGRRFATTTCTAVSKNGGPPGIVEWGKTRRILGRAPAGGGGGPTPTRGRAALLGVGM